MPNNNRRESEIIMYGFTDYQITIQRFFDSKEKKQFFAFLPDFGASSCSYVGDDILETIQGLQKTYYDICGYYQDIGKKIPKPSIHPMLKD